MEPHSSTLAWKIPWMEKSGGLQSMGSLGVGHDWATSLSLFTFMHWRRKWQPTPVFLPGESQGRESLMGCHLQGCTESDMTEATQQQQLEGINSRLSEAEEWVDELEDRIAEIETAEEKNKVKRMKRPEDSLRDLWDNIKCTNIQIIGVPE